MSEEEWLTCDDPAPLLEALPSEDASDRKLRLFSCAWVRRIWHELEDQRSRGAVEVTERFADGTATGEELNDADKGALAACLHDKRGARAAFALADHDPHAWADSIRNNPEEWKGKRTEQADLFRDVFGNPFRPIVLDRSWLSAVVTSLARAAYDERHLPSGDLDLVRLLVLADALEEAGCADADILAHLRSPGPHVRGCFAVDLVLGLT